MHEQLQFSDYSEWLDEGTEALVRDIADRATAKQAVGEPVRASQYELEISHDDDLGVYRASISDDVVANLSYKVVGHRVVLLSTSVLPQFRNHGIATALIGHALDDIRGTGRTVTIICPAVREFMDHYRSTRTCSTRTGPASARRPAPADSASPRYSTVPRKDRRRA
jgi:predicted GNAT family acetyltransferase